MTNRKKIAKRTKIALLLVLGPTVLIFTSLFLLVGINATTGSIPDSLPASCNSQSSENHGLFSPSQTCQTDLFGEKSSAQVAFNNFLFTVSGISVLVWLPCLIAGIILFIKRPKHPVTDEPINN